MSTEPLTLEQARNLLNHASFAKKQTDQEVQILFNQLQEAEARQQSRAKALSEATTKFISVGLGKTVYA